MKYLYFNTECGSHGYKVMHAVMHYFVSNIKGYIANFVSILDKKSDVARTYAVDCMGIGKICDRSMKLRKKNFFGFMLLMKRNFCHSNRIVM